MSRLSSALIGAAGRLKSLQQKLKGNQKWNGNKIAGPPNPPESVGNKLIEDSSNGSNSATGFLKLPLRAVDKVADFALGAPVLKTKITETEAKEERKKSGKKETPNQYHARKKKERKSQQQKLEYHIPSKLKREAFRARMSFLLQIEGEWTFGAFAKMTEDLENLYSPAESYKTKFANYWNPERKKEADESRRIFNAMTPEELRYTNYTQFSFKDRLMIAEAAGVSPETVLQMIVQFDTMKTQRTWLIRRLELGRSIPSSELELQELAQWEMPDRFHDDKPLYIRMREAQQKRRLKRMHRVERTKLQDLQARHHPLIRSQGHDRWAKLPTRSLYVSRSIKIAAKYPIKHLNKSIPKIKIPTR